MGKEKSSGKNIRVTSTDIKMALQERNPKDYFLTEVKNGSTYFPPAQGLLIFDGMGIRKSYTQPCITIYEVKVSRGDFLRDNKWQLYKQYCNELYFAVPKGLIDPSELPEDVGLIYYNPDTKKLHTKRKALYRHVDIPPEVYQYIVYTRLSEDRIPFYESRAEYAKDYLEDKKDKRYIGQSLGSKMAKDLEDAENRLKSLEDVEKQVNFANDVYSLLDKSGLAGFIWRFDFEKMLKTLEDCISQNCPKQVKDVKRYLESALREIEKMEENSKSECDSEISGEQMEDSKTDK